MFEFLIKPRFNLGKRTTIEVNLCQITPLSTNYSIEKYKKLETAQNKAEIANFFVERFTERYISPINSTASTQKSGFCTMAVSCLLIEALESFWSGWPDTDHKGPLPFCQFFSRCQRFHSLIGYAPAFYKHVRCGILHQAETTGGWTIDRHRDTPLFDPTGPRVNATKFHKALSLEIIDHANLLKVKDWNSGHWLKFRKKMKAVCKNCYAIQPPI